MSKSMVAVITAVITAIVSVCSTLVVVKYTDTDGTEKEVRAEIQYSDESGDNEDEFEAYELVGGQQTVEGDTSRYKVEIKSAKIAKNWNDEECLVITYIFTNNDDEPESFSGRTEDAVYQNGVALEHTSSSSDASFEFESYNDDDVKPGASYEFNIGYKLNDETSDLVVEVTNRPIYSAFLFSRTFSLS